MKTKFLFLAATLLMSANLFAQTNGDVNESGTVDAVDITTVIDVMQKAGGVAFLPASVKLNKSSFGFGVGMEVTLVPTIMPDNTTENTLTWSSSNPSVASVTQEGVVTGVAEGTTTITATTVNGKKATCDVTISNTVYFWYVGQTNPSTMTEISPIVTDTSSPGWRLIGTQIPTYTFKIPLYNAIENPIVSNPSTNNCWYVALPQNSSLSLYFDNVNEVTVGNWIKQSNITLNDITYNVYKSVATFRKFSGYVIR